MKARCEYCDRMIAAGGAMDSHVYWRHRRAVIEKMRFWTLIWAPEIYWELIAVKELTFSTCGDLHTDVEQLSNEVN